MIDYYRVLREPLLTEKCHELKEKRNQVVFKVEPGANKIQIKEAVEKVFKVKVKRVNVISMQGKKKRLGRRTGKRSDWKKAVVTLMPGEKVEIIEGVS